MPQDPPVNPKIVAHHVGARGFGVSFNVPEPFRANVAHVLYEADAECVERMLREDKSAMAQALVEKHVLPYCLGRRHGPATLNVTANSYASSILEPNPEFTRYYCEIPIDAAWYDVTYAEMLKVVRKVEVQVHSLDELFAAGKVPIAAAPDFLSLDTQGYELEILEGARHTLTRGVLGIVCEVEMLPMYRRQPLLGDILNFMTGQGFLFAGFTALYEVSLRRAAVGLRGKALPGFGDALFLRDLDWITTGRFAPGRCHLMLTKLAFIATCFGYIEYALEAVARAKTLEEQIPDAIRRERESLKYAKFMSQMDRVAGEQGGPFPPIHSVPDDSRPAGDTRTSWYDKHHKAALKAFSAGQPAGSPAAVSQVSSSPLARALYRALPTRFARALRRVFLPPLPPAGPTAATPHMPAYTALEKLLDDWGFGGPAYTVRQRRLAVEPYLRSLDGEMLEVSQSAHLPRAR